MVCSAAVLHFEGAVLIYICYNLFDSNPRILSKLLIYKSRKSCPAKGMTENGNLRTMVAVNWLAHMITFYIQKSNNFAKNIV